MFWTKVSDSQASRITGGNERPKASFIDFYQCCANYFLVAYFRFIFLTKVRTVPAEEKIILMLRKGQDLA